jgi:transcriptional regulator with GAF, ATPase, and Fis domain
LILQTLEEVRWIIGGPRGAAAKLGLKRTTLIHKMRKLGITRPSLQIPDRMSPAQQVP